MKDYFVDLSQRNDETSPQNTQSHERGIRNISVKRRTPAQRPLESLPPRPRPQGPTRGSGRFALWAAAFIALIILVVMGSLVYFAKTTITLIPRTHVITFDPSSYFTAYPGSGELSYTVETRTFDDSATVPAQGTERVEDRASGNVTVYNDYSDAPVRLIKNTRFQSSDGKIFRTPSSIEVPGKKDGSPGRVTITIIAEEAGETYNIAPGKLTVPGLKTTPAMFSGVYAQADTAFSGGFIGERPAVTAQALEEARSQIRTRLEEQTRQALAAYGADRFVFPALTETSFETLPTQADNGGARITERATMRIAVFDAAVFAQAVARAVSADAGQSTVQLVASSQLTATPRQPLTELGNNPIEFSLSGSGTLEWIIDETELKSALAGKDKGAFNPIVANFDSIQEARASVAPFWASAFPDEIEDIHVVREQSKQ